MDEKVTVNLVFFLLPLPSPARTIPSPLALLAMLPSPPSTIPFSPVNKFLSKLAPKVLKSILKNPPLCSLVSFSIALVTPFNKIPEFSSASSVFLFNN